MRITTASDSSFSRFHTRSTARHLTTMSRLAFALLVLLPLVFGQDCKCGQEGRTDGDTYTICNICEGCNNIPGPELPKGDCGCDIFGDSTKSCIKCKTSCN